MGIAQAGLSAEQIQHGIDRARVECEWPPSIAEFIGLARDIPSLADFLTGNEDWDNMARKACNVSCHDFKVMDTKFRHQWRKDVYPVLVKCYRQGEVSNG
jgi:hypothetical protein